MILVTHYQRLLDYIVPDPCTCWSQGRIVRSGGKELALELEEKGYGWLEDGGRDRGGRAMTPATPPTRARTRSSPDAREPRRAPRAAQPRWLARARRAALERFAEIGLPTTRDEEWKYTTSRARAKRRWRRPTAAGRGARRTRSSALRLRRLGGISLVFVDGRFAPALSSRARLPRACRVGSLADALATTASRSRVHSPRRRPATHAASPR